MPNKFIDEIYKAQLFEDSPDNLRELFKTEAWRAEPLSRYYGLGPTSEMRVDISVLRAMNRYCSDHGRVLGDANKAWLLSMVKTTTIVHKADDLGSAIELMSTAAQHTTPANPAL